MKEKIAGMGGLRAWKKRERERKRGWGWEEERGKKREEGDEDGDCDGKEVSRSSSSPPLFPLSRKGLRRIRRWR